jgi:hypothetical protein
MAFHIEIRLRHRQFPMDDEKYAQTRKQRQLVLATGMAIALAVGNEEFRMSSDSLSDEFRP